MNFLACVCSAQMFVELHENFLRFRLDFKMRFIRIFRKHFAGQRAEISYRMSGGKNTYEKPSKFSFIIDNLVLERHLKLFNVAVGIRCTSINSARENCVYISYDIKSLEFSFLGTRPRIIYIIVGTIPGTFGHEPFGFQSFKVIRGKSAACRTFQGQMCL